MLCASVGNKKGSVLLMHGVTMKFIVKAVGSDVIFTVFLTLQVPYDFLVSSCFHI